MVRRLLATFSNPEKARALLLEQRNSEEALEVNRKRIRFMPFARIWSAWLIAWECWWATVTHRASPPHVPLSRLSDVS
ncbi:hypothetical protein ACLB1O_17785 [Escherichia coli]